MNDTDETTESTNTETQQDGCDRCDCDAPCCRQVVGISFRKGGKRYFFDAAGFDLKEGMRIIAETARGLEYGEVTMEPVPEDEVVLTAPLKNVVRIATDDDAERARQNRDRELSAFEYARERIEVQKLEMKLIDVEYAFDASQATFFFVAESRVDFRQLVKELTGYLGRKVQMHQLGARDETKIFGGIGICGRALCCSSWMRSFEPVGMKMAKEQSLFLNPLKFSGTCSKLMCCLRYEYDMYKENRVGLPGQGAIVSCAQGRGRVTSVDILTRRLTIETETGAAITVDAATVTILQDRKKGGSDPAPDGE